MINLNKINKILWDIDPMNTGCKEKRGMQKEYWGKACGIFYLLDKGKDEHHAVNSVFDDYFYGEYVSDEQRRDALNQVANNITKEKFSLSPARIKLLEEVDSKFLRLVFRDAFIFSRNIEKYFELHESDFSIGQKKLAKKIRSKSLYPERDDDVFKLMDDLDDMFVWQSNSDGLLYFVGNILFLLDYFKKDADWFNNIWNEGVREDLSNGQKICV